MTYFYYFSDEYNCQSNKPSTCLKFNFTQIPGDAVLKSAELWMHKTMDPNDDNRQTFTITSKQGQSNKQSSDIKVIKIRTSVSHGWIQFPVHHFVKSWQKERERYDHSKQKNIRVSCGTCRLNMPISPFSQHGKYRPFLMVNLKPVKKSRTRRSVKQNRARSVKQNCARKNVTQPSPMNVCTAEQTGCCRENLTVSFSKLGWHFIIAPTEYNAYYCKGRCSGRF